MVEVCILEPLRTCPLAVYHDLGYKIEELEFQKYLIFLRSINDLLEVDILETFEHEEQPPLNES